MKSLLPTAFVLSLSVAVAPAFAEPGCKPVVGNFEASVVPPGQGHCPSDPTAFCTAGHDAYKVESSRPATAPARSRSTR